MHFGLIIMIKKDYNNKYLYTLSHPRDYILFFKSNWSTIEQLVLGPTYN